MADFFSDHWNAVAGLTAIEDPRTMVAPGLDHATVRYKRATVSVTTATAATDVLRFVTLKSGDRIHEVRLTHAADASTTVAGNFGLHQTGPGGALLDINLFCAVGTVPMVDITLAIARVDITILEAIDDIDRGKALWEMLFEGAGSDTEDPRELWDLTMTIANETGIVASEYILEVWYTAGGN
jgi:hypothetical protein